MARIDIRTDLDLQGPTLVEGLPGVGLVGKIVVDHLVDTFEMTEYAHVRCEGLPPIAVYQADSQDVRTPVRLYADPGRDLLALQSDVPVSPSGATEFASCLTSWIASNDVTPIYLSGRPADREEDVAPAVSGIATGGGATLLDDAGVANPDETGAISGPTGALLYRAAEEGMDGVGLIAEANPGFPDPKAAKAVIEAGVEPIADVTVDTDLLMERAGEIQEARERLARRMQQADQESSQAQPIRGFQ
jgi:uncharacterized protein